jgi:pimeloyl-ACP methyl ester carboxylesterase
MTAVSHGRHEIALPDGGELAAEEAGAGTPVVLIHGFSFDRSLWDPQFPALVERHQTMSFLA